MGDGFDHLRCPMCGGELIYSEGTHDLCCARNPYESMSGEEWEAAAALHEGRACYGEGAEEGDAGRLYIYKVWAEGEEARKFMNNFTNDPHPTLPPASGEGIKKMYGEKLPGATMPGNVSEEQPAPGKGHIYGSPAETHASELNAATSSAAPVKGHAEEKDRVLTSDTPVKTHKGLDKGNALYNPGGEALAGEGDRAQTSATPVKGHSCVFAVSFTESGRFGMLWSMRTVHAETNYFSLTRLMQKIEKRLRNGEPLAENAPNPPKKREKSAAAKLAFRFGIEEEDVYSIRFSTETVKRLALFYGIPERDVRRIREAEVEEE